MKNEAIQKFKGHSANRILLVSFVLTAAILFGGCSSQQSAEPSVQTAEKEAQQENGKGPVTLLNETSGDVLIDGIDMELEGDQVHFKLLGCDDPGRYEYEFFVKITGDTESDWRPQSEFGSEFTESYTMVSGGVYSFRFNIWDRENQKMQKIIVGSVDRGPRWVSGIALKPDYLTVELGASVQVLPEVTDKVDGSTLSYQVLVKYNQEDWLAVSDYQSLPLEPVRMEKEGICNICIKTLQKESGQSQVSDSVQVNVAEYQEENVELLMRTMLSYYGYYDYQDYTEAYDILSQELLAVSKSFLYEYRNDPDGLAAALKTQYELRTDAEKNVFTLQNAAGYLKEIDLDQKIILYGNDFISIALEDHPAIVKILESTKDFEEDQICAIIINNLLHNAYRYTATAGSTPGWNEFYDSDAQCLQFSKILVTLLGKGGYAARSYSCNRGEYGKHSVVEIGTGEQRIVLDPTYNVVYLSAMENMAGITDEKIMVLPQVFNRYEFYKSDSWKNLLNFGVTDEY